MDRPGVVVMGAAGRMGRLLVDLVAQADDLRLAGAVVRPGHAWIGQDPGRAMGGADLGLRVTDDALAAIAGAQAILDFTTPAVTVATAALAAQARAVHVIGTTGFAPADLAAITAAARHAPIIRAGNMSLGLNLLMGLTRRVAAALDARDWDIEIVETHHRHKVDAPSGAALMLGEAAAEGRGTSLDQLRIPAREGITGPRPPGGIGFAALRGGDVVGEHEVILAGPGERISLRHMASDRTLFARGALTALRWALDKGPGEYSMADVLGL